MNLASVLHAAHQRQSFAPSLQSSERPGPGLDLPPPSALKPTRRELLVDDVPLFTRPAGPRVEAAKQVFAEVRVGGRVVGTFYNNGHGAVRNGVSFGQEAPGPNDPQSGPDLAAWRADQLARATGGKVIRAPATLTQKQWDALPSITFVTDHAALENHREQLRRTTESHRTLGYGTPNHEGARTTSRGVLA